MAVHGTVYRAMYGLMYGLVYKLVYGLVYGVECGVECGPVIDRLKNTLVLTSFIMDDVNCDPKSELISSVTPT